MPLAIPIEAGRQYKVTQAGVNAAHVLVAQTWRARQDLRQTLARSEFDQIAFHAIGQTILDCRAHLPEKSYTPDTEVGPDFYAAMVRDFSMNLDRLADAARPDVDRHIPCHLFHGNQAVPAFSVGPIDFLPRADWIVRYVRDPAQLAYIQQVERREISYSDFRE